MNVTSTRISQTYEPAVPVSDLSNTRTTRAAAMSRRSGRAWRRTASTGPCTPNGRRAGSWNPPYSQPGPWVEKFLAHGNGVALLPFSNSAWWRDLWARDVAIAVHIPAAVDFIGGGIPIPTLFLAMGNECVAALPRVGAVRRLVVA